jgi:DNA-binding CsgD family transcriptional regulator
MFALSGTAKVDALGRARVRLRLARAAVAADRWDAATAQLDQARPIVAEQPGLAAEFAALSAQVAIGLSDLDGAARLARNAVSLAERSGQPDVQCEGWEIIGRTQRPSSLVAARESFDLARTIAEQHGLVVWQLRALHELGTIDLLDSGNIDRLLEARRGAEQAGALTMTAVLDVQLAAGHIMRGKPAQALAAGTGAAEAGRRLRAEGVRRMGLCFVAIAHGVLLDRDRMDLAAQEAVAAAGGELDIAAAVWGDARGIFALLDEDRRGARRALECAAELGCRSSAPFPSPWWGFWALVRAVDGGDTAAALQESERLPQGRHLAALRGFAAAVLLGRDGDAMAADRVFMRADADAVLCPAWRMLARRLVAEAALRDGWGDPLAWLSDAADYFDAFPAPAVASAARSLSRRGGAGGRRQGSTSVAPALAQLGVTSREAEVLALIGQGLSNREMAQRLYLSPRTVEKHVEHLAAKLGTRSRIQLVAYAATAHRDT